jgi:putative tryptophan/tyrosine transport system substrate-binding protein
MMTLLIAKHSHHLAGNSSSRHTQNLAWSLGCPTAWRYALLAIGLVFAIGCSSCNSSHSRAGSGIHTIRIVTPVSHPSLDETIRGFLDGLAEKGYPRNTLDLRPDTDVPALNANGDFSAIAPTINSALADKPELIFVVTTPAASQAAKIAAEHHVPLVYAAVTDPVKAGIVSSLTKSSTAATGVSDLYPVDKQVELFIRLLPTLRSAGIILNPKEENSTILASATENELSKHHIVVRRYAVNTTSDIVPRALQAVSENDALIVNGDNLTVQNISAVVNICIEKHRPLFVGDPDSVKKGAVATVGPSYYQMGKEAGYKAALILQGVPAGSIPSNTPTKYDYIINTHSASAMGLNIPEDIWSTRDIWISPASLTK